MIIIVTAISYLTPGHIIFISDRQYKVHAVVGLSTSRTAVMCASLLSIFKIPNLSLSATSDELSDKSRFEYFMRLLPADKNQVS